MDRKGVFTTDFIISFLWFLIILFFLTSLVYQRFELVDENNKLTDLRTIMDEVASMINLVEAGGPGHEMIFTLPPKIEGSFYSLKVNSTGVYGQVSGNYGQSFIYPCILTNAYGNPSTINLIPGKTYKIKNMEKNNTTIIMVTEVG